MDDELIERARRLLGAGEPRRVPGGAAGPLDWLATAQAVEAGRELKLRVHPTDAAALQSFPPYVVHQLRLCGPAVAAMPTAVFRGLRPDGTDRLRNGWALVGRPLQTTDQAGRAIPAPEDMVYVLFADEAGHVFDWDWMPADPADPNVPLAASERFTRRVHAPTVQLDLSGVRAGVFHAPLVSHSPVGDCIFCYLGGAPAYADRVDAQVTVFRSYVEQKVMGFKLKDAEKTRQWLVEIKREAVTVHTRVAPLLLAASLRTGQERHLSELLGRIDESVPVVQWRDELVAAAP